MPGAELLPVYLHLYLTFKYEEFQTLYRLLLNSALHTTLAVIEATACVLAKIFT